MTGESQLFTRRNFLKTVAAGLALGLGDRPVYSSAKDRCDLAVISGEPAVATRKALEAMGGISRFVKKGQRVVLKPNMSFANPPEWGSTTHPRVVATVAQACIEAGAQQVFNEQESEMPVKISRASMRWLLQKKSSSVKSKSLRGKLWSVSIPGTAPIFIDKGNSKE